MLKIIKIFLQFCLSAIVTASGIAFIAWLILKVLKGEGAELYFTGWGYKVSPLGALGFLAVFLAAVIVGYIFRYFHKREEDDFLNKYGKNRNK